MFSLSAPPSGRSEGRVLPAAQGLNVGDNHNTSSERVVAELIAYRTMCSDILFMVHGKCYVVGRHRYGLSLGRNSYTGTTHAL